MDSFIKYGSLITVTASGSTAFPFKHELPSEQKIGEEEQWISGSRYSTYLRQHIYVSDMPSMVFLLLFQATTDPFCSMLDFLKLAGIADSFCYKEFNRIDLKIER